MANLSFFLDSILLNHTTLFLPTGLLLPAYVLEEEGIEGKVLRVCEISHLFMKFHGAEHFEFSQFSLDKFFLFEKVNQQK